MGSYSRGGCFFEGALIRYSCVQGRRLFEGALNWSITEYEILEHFNDWMQKYWSKKLQKWRFAPFVSPQDFFSKIGLCHFYPHVVP